MADIALHRMTAAEFFDWSDGREERFELVDGAPRMMTGATRRHDLIVVNTLAALGAQLRGRPCRPFSADTAVAMPNGNRRRPDAGVECGIFVDESMEAVDPRLVVEVLSPSTREFDMFEKLEEYKSVAAIRHLVLIEPNAPEAMRWSRDESGSWRLEPTRGLDAAITAPDLGLALRLSDLYDGLSFRPQARLVDDESGRGR